MTYEVSFGRILLMPTVNVFLASQEHQELLMTHCDGLKELLARELSCDERELQPNEISVRVIRTVSRKGMLADVELDITAAAYHERVTRQDNICSLVSAWFRNIAGIEVKTWLALSELGHSMT